jgi:hypothetical protein
MKALERRAGPICELELDEEEDWDRTKRLWRRLYWQVMSPNEKMKINGDAIERMRRRKESFIKANPQMFMPKTTEVVLSQTDKWINEVNQAKKNE